MPKYSTLYEEADSHIWLGNRSHLNFPIYEENLIFFFISVGDFQKERKNELERTKYGIYLAHGDGDVDAEIPVVGEELRDARVEDEAVGIQDGGRDALVNGARRCLPRQPSPVPVQF